MPRISPTLALAVLGLAAGGVAFASGWADFESAFPAFPCNDGWTACYQNGERLTPDMRPGPSGMLLPANARLDWFDLKPTDAFSPFSTVAPYPAGGGPAVAQADQEPAPEPPPPPAPAPRYEEPAPSAPAPRYEEPAPAPAPAPRPAPSGGSSSMVRPAPSPQPSGMTRPAPAPAPSTMTRPAPSLAEASGGSPASCDNLVGLEPMAMMGRLTDEQIACLEASLAAADKQTDKDKISRVLMANAWSKGDFRSWEALVKRHLEEIDQSDPDLCYKYALYLSKKGPGRAWGVIKWADTALENRSQWVGATYKSRVYNLYKLRASAAEDLWKAAEEKHAAAPTDDTKKAVEDARGQTKTFAREWYEYAKSAGKDTTKALQLCISAAGTAEFCEGA